MKERKIVPFQVFLQNYAKKVGLQAISDYNKTKDTPAEKPDMRYRFGRLHPTYQVMEKHYDK